MREDGSASELKNILHLCFGQLPLSKKASKSFPELIKSISSSTFKFCLRAEKIKSLPKYIEGFSDNNIIFKLKLFLKENEIVKFKISKPFKLRWLIPIFKLIPVLIFSFVWLTNSINVIKKVLLDSLVGLLWFPHLTNVTGE